MKNSIVLSLISLVSFVPQLYSISMNEYIDNYGRPAVNVYFNQGYLNLSGIGITDLTGIDRIAKISYTTSLDLSGNQLKELPTVILRYLRNLIHLDLGNNQLETLPHDISKLTNLKSLNIDNNPFSLDADNIRKLVEVLQSMPNLEQLNGKPKNQALRRPPFRNTSTLFDTVAAKIAENTDQYPLHILPDDILEKLPLTQEERSKVILEQHSKKVLEQLRNDIDNYSLDQLYKYPLLVEKDRIQIAAEKVKKNIDSYRGRFHLLPKEIVDLLDLTPRQLEAITNLRKSYESRK